MPCERHTRASQDFTCWATAIDPSTEVPGTQNASLRPCSNLVAYLPVRDFGFKFVLQADFLLSSSREDIHKNSPWNIRIRDAIAEALVSAVPHFKSDEQLARTFLHYVPDVFDIVDDFFQKTVEHICALVQMLEVAL